MPNEEASMSYETIRVNRMAGALGAEIEGINIAEPLGNQAYAEIHDALIENQVIFFRDQVMSPESCTASP